jgi:Fic family protein
MIRAHFSSTAPVIHGATKPYHGWVVGYAAIIEKLNLKIPAPSVKAMVSEKNQSLEIASWKIFPFRYLPEDNQKISKIYALYNHLVFALKYEGVNLLVFAKLNEVLTNKEILELVNIEHLGQYSRRIWFLLEWASGKEIKGKSSISKKSYVLAIDESLQYAVKGVKSPRHLVINNLPGTNKFCALISKTKELENYLSTDYAEVNKSKLKGIRKDIIQRASAFLMLKDSKASFTIEGESPKSKRATRWATAIGQAGVNELTEDELIRLQQLVIENDRFIKMGFRTQGGFVGEHDRNSGEPIPEHISAKHEDLRELISGLLETNRILINDNFNPVLAAALIAFGFVFIHPFEDGNGRIHRYLIHHILARKKFSAQGIIFPVSSSILDHINDYKMVLESHSKPILDFIEWKETSNHNVHVINETKDYYRFFDGTKQAEFLFECVKDTVENIIPKEVHYLANYDRFKHFLDEEFEMPDKLVSVLLRFLEQNQGVLSKTARAKEFQQLTDKEVRLIEAEYASIFTTRH